jgi:hypothetical protein
MPRSESVTCVSAPRTTPPLQTTDTTTVMCDALPVLVEQQSAGRTPGAAASLCQPGRGTV